MPGCAITEVQIDGVLHEYSTMEGVQEDVIDILLNLKDISIVMHNQEEGVITLSKEGAGAVLAGDFQLTEDIEIANPDHVVCNLNEKGSIRIEARVTAILALKSFGHESGIVVDIGTACTIDVLENNRHMGGFILPGPKLACDALVANTDKIRFVSEPPAALAPGTDTGGCVVAGAWLTIAGAIREISAQYPQAPLYITGGAGPTLSDLGVEGRLAKDLVFDGLDFWLNGA